MRNKDIAEKLNALFSQKKTQQTFELIKTKGPLQKR